MLDKTHHGQRMSEEYKPGLVSVIIPCYNAERFVGEAIESALDQTYPHKEIIVIDDGSTDRSMEVIRSFASRIRWESGPSRGGCAARNRGLALARGELIQFLDADDLLYPEKLNKQVKHMEILGDRYISFCDGSRKRPPNIYERLDWQSGIDPVVFVVDSGLQTSAPLHRKYLLEEIHGFDESLPCSQERDLHLRLACCSDVQFVRLPETLFFVREVPNSVSSDPERLLEQHSRIFPRAYGILESRNALNEARRRSFARMMAKDANMFVHRGKYQKGIKSFNMAMNMHHSGGLNAAYSNRGVRFIHKIFGPVITYRIRKLKALLVSRRLSSSKGVSGDRV